MKHLVHITPSFAPGGAQVRTVMLMNYFGRKYRHTVLSLDSRVSAAARISPEIDVNCLTARTTANPLSMIAQLSRQLRNLAPDLVLTYNWGSIEGAAAAIARRLPLIHTEDGFGPEEATRQKSRRVWTRRIVLRGAYRAVAPSRLLSDMMEKTWRLPKPRIAYIPNGIDVERFAPAQRQNSDDLVIGTVGHLRKEKNLGLLIRSVSELCWKRRARLVVIGDGPERAALEQEALNLGIGNRVTFLGWRDDIPSLYRQFDIFALSSTTEQMPLSILEAMACGLPVVSTDVGDVWRMVAAENRAFVVSPTTFQPALCALVESQDQRATSGAANRNRAVREFSIERMFQHYETLYEHAIAGTEQPFHYAAEYLEPQHGLSKPK